jgi:hypothetical protein
MTFVHYFFISAQQCVLLVARVAGLAGELLQLCCISLSARRLLCWSRQQQLIGCDSISCVVNLLRGPQRSLLLLLFGLEIQGVSCTMAIGALQLGVTTLMLLHVFGCVFCQSKYAALCSQP